MVVVVLFQQCVSRHVTVVKTLVLLVDSAVHRMVSRHVTVVQTLVLLVDPAVAMLVVLASILMGVPHCFPIDPNSLLMVLHRIASHWRAWHVTAQISSLAVLQVYHLVGLVMLVQVQPLLLLVQPLLGHCLE